MLTREFVLSFREAAPYINAFRGKTFVLAVSGETVAEGHFPGLAQDINLLTTLGVRIVLVHGIRPQIDSLLNKQGVERQFHRQKRITDLPTLDIVKQAVGLARLDIEATLSMGMPNSPMHGSHLRISGGNMLTAQPLGVIEGMDMQYTGQVRRIDIPAITERLAAGDLVLLSPIGYSPTGEAFNLTMEEVATHAAIALKAEKLIFLVDGRGIISFEDKLLSTLTAQQAEDLHEAGNLPDDITLYLPYAIRATREGVSRAHLVSSKEDGALLAELFTRGGNGTMVARDPLVKVRTATIDDIGDILGLIRPLEEQGILVKRSRELLEMEIGNYSVLEHDKRTYGCVAMHAFPDADTAELACLAVSPEHRDAGFGEALLKHVEYQVRTRGLTSLFVLTTQTAHWFVERGFVETDPSRLPLSRQQLYNYQRRSKVFVKNL
ncbi:amino-acid N-acetyltransferase [Paludibacterium paludis]|uniref:Amino-acid acetyltransferase n=1 Tax=Paludibacterium paludis TaxID=1225769 RepID=A0A918NX45_9NEIS|nr:amino-acid N-acetyltransferase [Paludibacterium paludis]GGY02423.1 amino-acid acetyltransferase [Paludibacterium paludis]